MSTINLTAREQELLCAVVRVMKAEIDWDKVARLANFNTKKQARDKWPAVRDKLIGSTGGASAAAAGGKDDSEASTPVKKGVAMKRKIDGGGGGGAAETGAKKKKAKKAKSEMQNDDGEDDGESAKGVKDEDEGDLLL